MEPTPDQLKAMQEADAARMVLENPLVASALANVERAIIDVWASLGVDQLEKAQELKYMLHAAKQFRAVFEVTIAGGDVAKHELLDHNHMQARAEAARRRIYG